MMNRKVQVVGVISVVLASAACGSGIAGPDVQAIKYGNSIATYPGAGGVLISNTEYIDHNREEHDLKTICVAPPPQAALVAQRKFTGTAKVDVPETVGAEASASAESQASATTLYELHDASLLLQHALYRLCEATANRQIGRHNLPWEQFAFARVVRLQEAAATTSREISAIRLMKEESAAQAAAAKAAYTKCTAAASQAPPQKAAPTPPAPDCSALEAAKADAERAETRANARLAVQQDVLENLQRSTSDIMAQAKSLSANAPDAGPNEYLFALDQVLAASLAMADRDVRREEARAERAKAEAAKAETELRASKTQAKLEALQRQIDDLNALALGKLVGGAPATSSADAGGRDGGR